MTLKERNTKDKITSAIREILERELSDQGQEAVGRFAASLSAGGSFQDIQNGFYNALCDGLGLSRDNFQILQPSPPLPKDADQELWDYFNNLPSYSLTGKSIPTPGAQFYSNYSGLISALKAPKNTFRQDIGEEAHTAWMNYIVTANPIPAPSQLPDIFFNWASIFYPEVANVGASDLAALLLNPIGAANLALMPYQKTFTQPARLPDWRPGYATLMQQLANAPSQKFRLDTSSMDTNVSNTWSKGSNSGFFGLWGGSSSTSSQSQQFSSSSFSVDASFAHVLTFQATPGTWYTSSAMGLAYSKKSGDPWNPNSPTNWNNTFDPQGGNLARFMVSLIVVDQMQIVVESSAQFSKEDQTTIENNKSAGLWPFYTTSNTGGAHTSATFDDQGRMTIEITSKAGVPIVIGGNVLPVDQFVGHAVKSAQAMASLR
jgi:hypothetical protein